MVVAHSAPLSQIYLYIYIYIYKDILANSYLPYHGLKLKNTISWLDQTGFLLQTTFLVISAAYQQNLFVAHSKNAKMFIGMIPQKHSEIALHWFPFCVV